MGATFPQIILGYHGCDRDVGEDLLTGRLRLKPSVNEYDWLGSGIYFWENSPDHALKWAKEGKENPAICKGRIKEPFVLGALIAPQKCLDLLDTETCELLRAFYDSYCRQQDVPIPANRGKLRKLDCFMVNNLVDSSREKGIVYDTVRGAFFEGDEIMPDSGFRMQTHIQICVRDPECILGYFLPAGF